MELKQMAAAARDGDESAFYALMQRYKLQMYRIAREYLGGHEDALEAVQETTYRAYVRIGKLREPEYAGTWLIRILLNVCADERRRRKRSIPAPEVGSQLAEEMRLLDKMLMEDLVGGLDDPYQEIVRMKYYEDLTIPEIAKRLGRPEGTIKTWLNKALQGLRRSMNKGGDERG